MDFRSIHYCNNWLWSTFIPNILVVLFALSVHSQSPVFLVNPVSVAAIHGTTVEFTCTANNTDTITYRVNDTSATFQSVISKGFTQLGFEVVGSLTTRRNLTVTVSSLYNNTKIFCRAQGSPMNTDSAVAVLIVQGPLSSVSDLSSSFINSSTVNISWNPPFTLPGTAITGYNISVTISNGTTTNYFTSDSYYVIQLSDITDSPCNEINITVSGYNSLNGEINSISGLYLPSVSSPDANISFSVKINSFRQLMIEINVATLCIGERPSNLSVELISSITQVGSVNDIMLPQDPATNIQTVNTTLTVLEDQRYTAVVSFCNLAGEFNTTSKIKFTTFGLESVVITDTTGGRVCLKCSFSSFSTDTGCTVELVSSDSSSCVQYTETINRSGNGTAEGCVSGVTAGAYIVRVYDQSGSMLVHEVNHVTVMSLTTTTSTGKMSPPSMSSISAIVNTTNESESYPVYCTHTVSFDCHSTEQFGSVFVVIGFISGVFTTLLLAVLVGIVLVIVKQKYRVEKEGCNLADKSSVNPVILTDVNPAYGEVKNTDTTRTVYDTVQ